MKEAEVIKVLEEALFLIACLPSSRADEAHRLAMGALKETAEVRHVGRGSGG